MFVFRFLLGLGIGPKSATIPIYASECAPANVRGALVMMWQVFTAFGIMCGFFCGAAFRSLLRGHDNGFGGFCDRSGDSSRLLSTTCVSKTLAHIPRSSRGPVRLTEEINFVCIKPIGTRLSVNALQLCAVVFSKTRLIHLGKQHRVSTGG